MNNCIVARGIVKRFPGGVMANQDVSLKAWPGEIHAVLGENGAGKTTLMKVLAGLYEPDAGHVEIDGREYRFRCPKDAKDAGVGMVQQHFALIPALTVAENLALGNPKTPRLFDPRSTERELREAAERYGFQIRPEAYVWQLSMGERQRVEIFRLLLGGARILILDEPTSVLAPQEAEQLFGHLRRFAEQGHTILLVTHKIQHVMNVADRVTILRRGRVVTTRSTSGIILSELVQLMVGDSKLDSDYERRKLRKPLAPELLEVEQLNVSPMFSPCGLRDVSFSIRPGEILGVAGISGNGQDELAAALTGGANYKGTIQFGDRCSPDRSDGNLAYIPSERKGVGVAVGLSVEENLALRGCDRRGLTRGPLLRSDKMREEAGKRITEYDIRPDDPTTVAGNLSGGNLQKLVLARELAGRPKLIVAVNPTAGLDVSTAAFVRKKVMQEADEGVGVLVISEDLDELLAVCDRVMVFHTGRLAGVFEAREENRQEIGRLMTGIPAHIDTQPVAIATLTPSP